MFHARRNAKEKVPTLLVGWVPVPRQKVVFLYLLYRAYSRHCRREQRSFFLYIDNADSAVA